MGRQWERQLLLPFSFYIDAKVLLFFELAKFNLECEPHGQKCGTGGSASRTGDCGTSGTGGTSETSGTRGRIIRLSFGYPSLIVRSSCIVGIGEVVEEKKLLLSSFFLFLHLLNFLFYFRILIVFQFVKDLFC